MTRHSTSAAQSKSNARLLIFAILSTLLCMLALANVASAASSAEDQYVEKAPTGSGQGGAPDPITVVDTNGDGVVSEAEVKKAAKKKKKAKKDGSGDDDGSTGGTGAVSGSGTPPSSSSPVTGAATSAKVGPFSSTTAAILGLMVLALGGLGLAAHFRRPPLPGGPGAG